MGGSHICASREGFVGKHGRWVAIRQADEGEESVSDKYEAMFHAGHTARASGRLGCKWEPVTDSVSVVSGSLGSIIWAVGSHGQDRINRTATWPDESFRFFGQHGGGQTGAAAGRPAGELIQWPRGARVTGTVEAEREG